MYIEPELESSYALNNLGITLYNYVRYIKPDVIIEFGALNGYSTICMAQALRENGKGRIKLYDLFEKYEYQHATLERLVDTFKEYGVLDYIDIEEKNFFDWIKNPEPFDLLHLDISNTGDIIDILYDKLGNQGKNIIFEGGSEQRDKVGWMQKYNKKHIRDSHAKFEIINPNFPSLSKML